MKPVSSLFAKILSWFFLNLILVIAALSLFFAFQPQVDLHAIFGKQGSNRLRTAGMLISHDLNQTLPANWPDILARHSQIHQVDFALILEDGSRFFSKDMQLPEEITARVTGALQRSPHPGRFPPPSLIDDPPRHLKQHKVDGDDEFLKKITKKNPPLRAVELDQRPRLTMRTKHPTRYWTGIGIPVSPGPLRHPAPALLLAVSDSITGNGFFFDPLPWMIVAGTVILISVLFWIPMVKNITRPLTRMTRATEEIAKGRFDVAIHEPRGDEIGRLAKAINHMTSRLSDFVKGQKRFLGDVAHELGSPIARIQFGLGALEQRVQGDNRQRVVEVMEDVDHMSKLVNELLAFSRAEMKTRTILLESIDLLPVVQEAVKRENLPEVKIIANVDPEIRVVASAELLTRALANLIRNAVKYAGDAGAIYISAEKNKDEIAIEVRDTGPGVAEDLLDQLFEPFFRPEPSRDRNSGGVGLGLAIVKTCVETCQGTVSARNLKPKGFAVTITLKTL
ncbi:MAG: HAMP domain-containing sensor histidine kinase [Desulfobacterales bacterium]|nr:HAMP domain-containing sensor histidine kinase [Desulfobacterales bacterium]MDD4071984.1 HAMP domain-containing sensor histidine kinase [Desulfobacterales bacterium]MDD4392252.1 HAMP domain-containing sensor histidine kinase [Desulfobacterales bacterium]